MATRRPLVIVDGLLSDLLEGDSVRTSDQASNVIAGSGLGGGGDASSDISLQINLAASPSGVIYVGDSIGLDGSDIVQANTALSSGIAAQVLSNTALSSGVAAIFTAESALASGNAALAGIIPLQGGDAYTAVYTASSNVSVGDAVGVDDSNRVRPIYGEVNASVRNFNNNVASGYYAGSNAFTCEPSGSYITIVGYNSSDQGYYFSAADVTGPTSITVYPASNLGLNGSTWTKGGFTQIGSTNSTYNLYTFAFYNISISSANYLTAARRNAPSATYSYGNSQFVSTSLWVTDCLLAEWPNNGVLMAYGYQTTGGSSRTTNIRLGTISNVSFTFGNELSWASGAIPQAHGLIYDPAGNRAILIENFNNSNGIVRTYSISGTNLSGAANYFPFTALPINSTYQNSTNMAYDESTNSLIFFYRTNVSGSFYIAYIVFYWNGSGYTFGTPTILSSVGASNFTTQTYDKINQKIVVKYYANSSIHVAIGSISGTTFTVESTKTTSSVALQSPTGYNVDNDLVIFANSQYITTYQAERTITPTFNSYANFVGIADTAAVSGNATVVSMPGALNYSRTGLTPGAFYYPDITVSGSLTTSTAQPSSWSSQTAWRSPLRAVSSSGLLVLDSI